ncbi:MAG: HEAT repeat domain-containing protein [Candidatus Riflebacteria bacterium]|nr:HEAT repeat domain-containing protein [Candidatus Riflebacteria bacterium]
MKIFSLRMETDEILINLESQRQSDRLIALQRLEKIEFSETIFHELLSRFPGENDLECRRIYSAILKKWEKFCFSEKAPKSFENIFSKGSREEKLLFLACMDEKSAKHIAAESPRLLSFEKEPDVQASIMRTLGKYWPENDIPNVLKLLNDRLFSVRSAALELIVERSPISLKNLLPHLLTASETKIRIPAIRGLASIDPSEAVLHLDRLLNSAGMASDKQAALQCSVFLPFNLMKPVLLKFIAIENDPEFLKNAGALIISNPDPEIPYQLWEMAENASEIRSQALKDILRAACKSLEVSQILPDFHDYMKKLKEWVEKREARNFFLKTIQILETRSSLSQEEAAKIRKALNMPLIREVFQQCLEWPSINSELRCKILQIIEECELQNKTLADTESKSKTDNKTESKSINLLELENRYLIISLASMQIKDKPLYEEQLRQLLKKRELPSEVTSIALEVGLTFRMKDFCEIARKHLFSKDTMLQASAMEYLAFFDIDELVTYIGKFLASETPRIQATALKILQKTDLERALSFLSLLLRNKNSDKRALGLQCLIFFEFPIIVNLLTDILIETPLAVNLETALCFFQANPSIENLYYLYKLEQVRKEKSEIRKTRLANQSFLLQTGVLKEIELKFLESELEKKYKAQEKKKESPPEYSVKKLYNFPTRIADRSYLFKNFQIVFFAFCTIFFLKFFIFNQSEKKSMLSENIENNSKTFIVSGIVTKIESLFCILTESDGKEHKIFLNSRKKKYQISKVNYLIPGITASFEIFPQWIDEKQRLLSNYIDLKWIEDL